MHHHKRSYLKTFLPFVLLFFTQVPALAEEDTAALRRQLDSTYQEVLKNPQDRRLTLRYAAIAMQLKDYEAAIPPLERILMNEPNNAKIKLQLGILYQSLGSKLMAKQYFIDAKNSPGVSAAIASEAENYLHGL